MTIGVFVVAGLVLALAWANGANDIAKGIATLVGNGTASARRAVWWGTLWTVAGGLSAVLWGGALLKTFSSGYLEPGFQIDQVFVASSILGAVGWIGMATWLGLPVSTTHALLGGVVGAALMAAGPDGLRMGAVTSKALLPLLVAPLLAVGLCAAILLLARYVAGRVPAWRPGCCSHESWQHNPFVCAEPSRETVPLSGRRLFLERSWVSLHWLSSGMTSFARGLNDVPKIAAFLVLAVVLVPGVGGGVTDQGRMVWPIVLVTAVMGLGSLWGGMRVLEVMAHRVTPLDASSGLVANAGTSLLVLLASPLGLPVSTTHVSTGALMGVRWTERAKPRQTDALRLILYGWVVTLPVAAALAALGTWLLAQSRVL